MNPLPVGETRGASGGASFAGPRLQDGCRLSEAGPKRARGGAPSRALRLRRPALRVRGWKERRRTRQDRRGRLA